MRAAIIGFLKEHHVLIAGLCLLVVVVIDFSFIAAGAKTKPMSQDAITGRISAVIFNGVALTGGSLAFAVSCLLPKGKWGDAEDFRIYLLIGSAFGLVAAVVFFLNRFGIIQMT